MDEQIRKAVKILNQGGIVIFPTDTAFGIGCRIDSEEVVKRLFKIRKRPISQAVPVLANSIEMAKEYLLPVDIEVMEIMKTYWPGALTLILCCIKVKVPKLVRGGGDTLGVRIPNHKITLEIIKKVGVPILGPSANFHGEKTPYRFKELDKNIVRLADFVIEGECLVCEESTVLDCSQKEWKVLRQGAVKIQNSEFRIQNSKKTILFIDTSSNKEIKVSLIVNDRKYLEKQNVGFQKSQVVLELIDKILKKSKTKIEELDEIIINTGPGSFTGIRVGVAIANAFSYALNISLNGKKTGEFVEPRYE